MSEHRIETRWSRGQSTFAYDSFSRSHLIEFPGGQQLQSSSAPDYSGDARLSNPEELLLAALSSCHMLTFLAIAAKRGYVVEHYVDAASAMLEKNADGKLAVTRVSLRPEATFSGDKQPDRAELDRLHHKAHQHCVIANSVRTEVVIAI